MRLAIVVPRYGEGILGGAETFARQFAEHLPRDEFAVEVLTTCAHDLQTWRNVFPAGVQRVNDVLVRRFPVAHCKRDVRRHRELTARFVQRWPATVEDEYEWIARSAHSPALYAYIHRHGPEYELLVFLPYLFGITYYGISLWPERSILWPCLHDEPFARFLETRLMMQACRGLMFMSEPEMALAHRLGIHNPGATLVGFGFDDVEADPARFRQRWGISEPFVLYSGRLEALKNVLELVAFFIAYKQARPGPLKLVLMGTGPLAPPAHRDVIPIGFLSGQEKQDAYAAATVLCQPSRLESFSIVLMEAWLAGVPVLVHGECEVTRHHVLRANGGLYYSDLDEFIGALDWLLEHPAERRRMGQAGRAYVRSEYNWATVLQRFRAALEHWQRL
jgi:glycosyltransferase involved in cell wall biosynthesis